MFKSRLFLIGSTVIGVVILGLWLALHFSQTKLASTEKTLGQVEITKGIDDQTLVATTHAAAVAETLNTTLSTTEVTQTAEHQAVQQATDAQVDAIINAAPEPIPQAPPQATTPGAVPLPRQVVTIPPPKVDQVSHVVVDGMWKSYCLNHPCPGAVQ